jgi:hypothetical protein
VEIACGELAVSPTALARNTDWSTEQIGRGSEIRITYIPAKSSSFRNKAIRTPIWFVSRLSQHKGWTAISWRIKRTSTRETRIAISGNEIAD